MNRKRISSYTAGVERRLFMELVLNLAWIVLATLMYWL